MRIERWRKDDGQRDVALNQAVWTTLGLQEDVKGKSIAAVSSMSQDRYDRSRRKKLILRWQAQQDAKGIVEEMRRACELMKTKGLGRSVARAFCGVAHLITD